MEVAWPRASLTYWMFQALGCSRHVRKYGAGVLGFELLAARESLLPSCVAERAVLVQSRPCLQSLVAMIMDSCQRDASTCFSSSSGVGIRRCGRQNDLFFVDLLRVPCKSRSRLTFLCHSE